MNLNVFQNEIGCRLIRENYGGQSVSFKSISKEDIIEAVKKLPSNKASVLNGIPTSMIKNFATFLFTELNTYMENKFSKYLTGFRKNYNAQNSLLRMIESWEVRLNNGSKVVVIIMDLSKVFDSLNHKLRLTKLKAYG